MKQTAVNLQGKEETYGKVLSHKRIFMENFPIAISFAAPAWVGYRRIWMAVLVFVIAFIISCSENTKPNEAINYHKDSLKQRHEFIDDMTMALSQRSQTTLKALDETQEGLQGEFKTDIAKLEDIIYSSSPGSFAPHQAFQKLLDKYHEDTYFCQYLQEIEHAFQSGTVDMKTCDNISSFHDQLFQLENHYGQRRTECTFSFILLNLGVTALLFAASQIVNNSAWVNIFAHKPIGVISVTGYLIILAVDFAIVEGYNHDDTIVSFN